MTEKSSGIRWYGKPIEEYTKDELIEIIKMCVKYHEDTRETMRKINQIHTGVR